jgi:hypothetical protein
MSKRAIIVVLPVSAPTESPTAVEAPPVAAVETPQVKSLLESELQVTGICARAPEASAAKATAAKTAPRRPSRGFLRVRVVGAIERGMAVLRLARCSPREHDADAAADIALI